MKTEAHLVILGSINYDQILHLESFPSPGETVAGNYYQVAFGGKGANQAVAAGRSGANISFISCVGNDDIGERVLEQLSQDNVDISPVSVVNGESTGVALIFVSSAGENVIGSYAGANAALTIELVEEQHERIARATALLIQLESPVESILTAAKIAHEYHTTVVLNPAPAYILLDEVLELTDIITPNKMEIKKLTGIHVENDDDAARAAKILHGKGINTVIITLGSMGVWVSIDSTGYRMPSFQVKAVDTVAAGDTFNGALMTALLEGKKLNNAIRFAQAAAAIAVTRKGVQLSIPWRKEIDSFLSQHEEYYSWME